MVTQGVARRLIAATAVTFTALATLLASGVTISVARAAPLALTAPLDPSAAAAPVLTGAVIHIGDVAASAPSVGPAVGPAEAASCTCSEQVARRGGQTADRERAAQTSLVIARAPPR